VVVDIRRTFSAQLGGVTTKSEINNKALKHFFSFIKLKFIFFLEERF